MVLAVFAWWALRPGEHRPVVNIRLLSVRSLGSASAVLFTAGAAMYAGLFLLPLYYQDLRGEDVLVAALLLIPQGVGALVSRFVVGRLVGRFGASAVTIAAFLLAAVATVPFAFAGPAPACGGWVRSCWCAASGLAPSSSRPCRSPTTTSGLADIPHATMNTRIAQQVGASFGVAIVAVVLQSLLAHGAVNAFHTAFWVPASGITVAAFIPALGVPPPPGRRTMADVSTDPAPNAGRKPGRRRGASLEDAILDAAWEQLTAEGYGHFTIDTVAARARTSKPVLYRCWKTSDELLHAAIRHRGAVTAVPDPDTGTLRGDLLALLGRANTLRSDMAALLSSMLGSYFDQTALGLRRPAQRVPQRARPGHRTRHRARHRPG